MEIRIEKLNPTENSYNSIIEYQFKFRKTGIFIGENLAAIGNVTAPLWWNRPLKEEADQIIKLEADNLYSINLPMLSEKNKWKKNYNILVNEWSIPMLMQLKFKNTISESGKNKLRSLLFNTMYKTLVELGVPDSSIANLNNDLLINGRKVAGTECYLTDNIYCSSVIFTLKFKQEQEIFSRLTYGKMKPKRQITGILDEFDIKYTKQECLNIFKSNLEYFINQVIQNDPLDE